MAAYSASAAGISWSFSTITQGRSSGCGIPSWSSEDPSPAGLSRAELGRARITRQCLSRDDDVHMDASPSSYACDPRVWFILTCIGAEFSASCYLLREPMYRPQTTDAPGSAPTARLSTSVASPEKAKPLAGARVSAVSQSTARRQSAEVKCDL